MYILQHDIAHYQRLKNATTDDGKPHPDCSYHFLYGSLKQHLARKLNESQRAEELGAISAGKGGGFVAPFTKGKGKGKKKKQGKGKGKGKGGARGAVSRSQRAGL